MANMNFPIILFLFCCMFCASQAQSLITNGDFETDLSSDWTCAGNCGLFRTPWVKNNGSYSVLVSGRKQTWHSLVQYVNFKAGKRYRITAQVRLKATTNTLTTMRLFVLCTVRGKNSVVNVGLTPKMVINEWYELGGAAQIQWGSSACKVQIASLDSTAEYYVDDVEASLVFYQSWKNRAIKRIEEERKADVQILMSGTNINNRIVDVEIKQRKHAFVFGASVRADKFEANVTNNNIYQNVLYDNFEWGVAENMLNWNEMQPTENEYNDDMIAHAMQEMHSNGIRQRCHSAFMAADADQASWVTGLDNATMSQAITERIANITSFTGEMCEHWTVNNDYLAGDFFESKQYPGITNSMFTMVKTHDDGAVLFLNEDYSLYTPGTYTVALKDAALKLKNAGIPIGGIGIKAKFGVAFDPHLTMARLDILAEAGLPLIISEFAVDDPNDVRQATRTRDLLNLFYSHMSVSGVMFRGFWDGNMDSPHAAMFPGMTLEPNAAGDVYRQFFHNDWRTRDHQTLLGGNLYTVRGYHGEYDLIVSYQGQVIKQERFTLDDFGRKFNIHLLAESGYYPCVDYIERGYADTTTAAADIYGVSGTTASVQNS